MKSVDQNVPLAQAQNAFLQLGETRAQQFDSTGLSVPLEAMRQYYRDLAQGELRAAPLNARDQPGAAQTRGPTPKTVNGFGLGLVPETGQSPADFRFWRPP